MGRSTGDFFAGHLLPAAGLRHDCFGEHLTRLWRVDWDVDEGLVIRYQEEAEYVEQYRSLLAQRCATVMRSTGLSGISSAGGLDSTALAVLADPLPPKQARKTCLVSYAFYELSDCDERRYIRPIVDRYQIQG